MAEGYQPPECDTVFTWVEEPSVTGTHSWVIITGGTFRSAFQDTIERTIDIRVYAVESDSTEIQCYDY